MSVLMVLGGRYGSEGKGSVVSWLAKEQEYDLVIRSGSPNAGHTFKMDNGELVKMRTFPCTWYSQSTTPIYLSASTVINKEVFIRELQLMRDNGYDGDVMVSPQAVVIQEEAVEAEKNIETGTTGEGVGATRAAKCMRQASLVQDDDYFKSFIDHFRPHHLIDNRLKHILIEGTQGYGLSLDGKRYPYVTSTNLTTHRLLDDAEIPFGVHEIHPLVVFRTHPIRIAGTSGDLFNETSWGRLRAVFGEHIPDEQTTVTKKTRRVGEFDPSLAHEAVLRLGAKIIVLTFVDYIFPNIKETGVTDEINHWLIHMESAIGRSIHYLGIGIGELIPRGIS